MAEQRRRSEASPLHELVTLAREKGYAIDFAMYGGAHLDEYVGGARITGADDPMDSIRAGLREMKKRPHNPDRETY